MTQFDAFEQKLTDSLQSDEMPSADFTARVMAQVAKTPQVRAGSSKRTWKIVLTAAACLAVVCVAVPVVFFGAMRAGSAAPQASDCAAPAEAPAAMEPSEAEAACEENAAEGGVVNSFSVTADNAAEEEAAGAVKNKDESAAEEVSVSDAALCQKAREILSGMGLESDSGYYALTAEQGLALHGAMPELKLPAGAFILVLEE